MSTGFVRETSSESRAWAWWPAVPADATNIACTDSSPGATLPVMASDSWRGKWALVTGASSGIGAALAEELAAGGAHLVLTARRARRLAKLRHRLQAAYDVRIEVLPGDLAQPKTPTEIFSFTQERGITVDLLVNNAGVGSYGAFRASDRQRELGIIQLNCSALVHLTHLYLLDMVERRSGAILTVSSLRHTRVCPTWPPTPQAKGSAYSSPRR